MLKSKGNKSKDIEAKLDKIHFNILNADRDITNQEKYFKNAKDLYSDLLSHKDKDLYIFRSFNIFFGIAKEMRSDIFYQFRSNTKEDFMKMKFSSYNTVVAANAYYSNQAKVGKHFENIVFEQMDVIDVLNKQYYTDAHQSHMIEEISISGAVQALEASIVALSMGKGSAFGTGILINSDLVLTARHCIEERNIPEIIVRINFQLQENNKIDIWTHQNIAGVVELRTNLDYAIILLSQPIPNFRRMNLLDIENQEDGVSLLIHHPKGWIKKVSAHNSLESIYEKISYVGFQDSSKGSSGGAYINAKQKIFALHGLNMQGQTSAIFIKDIYQRSKILKDLDVRVLEVNTNRVEKSEYSIRYHEFLETIEEKPSGYIEVNSGRKYGSTPLTYHHIIHKANMEFLWMLCKLVPDIESKLISLAWTPEVYKVNSQLNLALEDLKKDASLRKIINKAVWQNEETGDKVITKTAIDYLSNIPDSILDMPTIQSGGPETYVHEQGKLVVNYLIWAPWDLFVGPTKRADDPGDKKELNRPIVSFTNLNLWHKLEELNDKIEECWSYYLSEAKLSKSQLISNLDNADGKGDIEGIEGIPAINMDAIVSGIRGALAHLIEINLGQNIHRTLDSDWTKYTGQIVATEPDDRDLHLSTLYLYKSRSKIFYKYDISKEIKKGFLKTIKNNIDETQIDLALQELSLNGYKLRIDKNDGIPISGVMDETIIHNDNVDNSHLRRLEQKYFTDEVFELKKLFYTLNNSQKLKPLSSKSYILNDNYATVSKGSSVATISLFAESSHTLYHKSNILILIEIINNGKILTDIVICLERKQQGNHLGMSDVSALGNYLEQGNTLSSELHYLPIYNDALLCNAAKAKVVQVTGIEGKGLTHSKESPYYHQAREEYMAEQLVAIARSGKNAIFLVGEAHINNLIKLLGEQGFRREDSDVLLEQNLITLKSDQTIFTEEFVLSGINTDLVRIANYEHRVKNSQQLETESLVHEAVQFYPFLSCIHEFAELDLNWQVQKLFHLTDLWKFESLKSKYEITPSFDVFRESSSNFRKSVLLKLHPDKNPDKPDCNDDFVFVTNLREKLNKPFDAQKFINEKIQTIQPFIYKANLGLKTFDTAIDTTRLIYIPTIDNAKKILIDITHLYSMYSRINGLSTIINGADIAYKAYQGEYGQALTQSLTTAGYMLVPVAISFAAAPYVGFVYGATLTAYSGYGAITNAYSFYQGYYDKKSDLKSITAYKNLFESLSNSPLQYTYDFTSKAKEYETSLNNIKSELEKAYIKEQLEEKGEFGQKLYDYIYSPMIEEKYELLNQVAQSILTEAEANNLKAKHIQIMNYDHCMEIISLREEESNIYYCYNEEQQIFDYIAIIGEAYVEKISSL